MSQLGEQSNALEDMGHLSVTFLERMQHLSATVRPLQRQTTQQVRPRRSARPGVERDGADIDNTTVQQLFLGALIYLLADKFADKMAEAYVVRCGCGHLHIKFQLGPYAR